MPETIIDSRRVNEVMELFHKYQLAIESYHEFELANPYKLVLHQAIEDFIRRKEGGDLKDQDHIPDLAQIKDALIISNIPDELTDNEKNAYGIFTERIKQDKMTIDELGEQFVKMLRDPEFLSHFENLPFHQKIEKKSKIISQLPYSQSGEEYLKECFTFDEEQDPSLLFGFLNLSHDILAIKEIRDPLFLPDLVIKSFEIYQRALPDMLRYTQVNINKTYFIITQFSQVYFEDFGLRNVTNYRQIDSVEFEITILETEEIKIKNELKVKWGKRIVVAKALFSTISLFVTTNATMRDPSLKNRFSIVKASIDFLAEWDDVIKAIWRNPPDELAWEMTKFSKGIHLLKGINSFIVSPIIFHFTVEEFALAAISG